MKTQKSHNKGMFVTILTTLALQGCAAGKTGGSPDSANRGEKLFSSAEVGGMSEIADAEPGERSLRKRFVKVNRAIIAGAVAHQGGLLELNLFDDEDVSVILEDVQKIADDNVVIVGRIQNDPDSAVTIVMKGEAVVANVRRGDRDESFEVRYAANGVHLVRKPEAVNDDTCATEDELAQTQSTLPDEPTLGEEAERGANDTILATPTVDMLVAYTPRARYYQGGTSAMLALIQMGIADTNRALSDSGSLMRVRLAGTMELRQNESGYFSSDLNSLKGKYDGRWDEVHAKRSALGADQVTVVGAYNTGASGSVAGIGFVNASYSSAFTVVKASMFRQYTFSHELGHNLGLNHSDGYVNSAGRFRTIIAYGSYPRIRRYSNPSLTYNGYSTGNSYHNEVKILNSRASYVSSFLAPKFL